MTNSTVSADLQALFDKITAAELEIVKGPLLKFAETLETPGANILTVQEAANAVLLSLPQLSLPAQAAALNLIGEALHEYLATLGETSDAGKSSGPGTAA